MTIPSILLGYFNQIGSESFTKVGINSYVVPVGVTSISAVLVGGGGGGAGSANNNQEQSAGAGGGLRWINGLPVVQGETLTIYVGTGGTGGALVSGVAGNGAKGGDTYLKRETFNSVGQVYLFAQGGGGALYGATGAAAGIGGTGSVTGITTFGTIGGGNGGNGGTSNGTNNCGGGGAGGYSGVGGAGAGDVGTTTGQAGSGGGGGGGGRATTVQGFGAGGVDIVAEGSNGTAGGAAAVGGGGSGGSPGSTRNGGLYGGGGAGGEFLTGGNGAQGAARIIWADRNMGGRSYPNKSQEYATKFQGNPGYFGPTYFEVLGTKAPVYGAGGAALYPPDTGWTGLQNASVDDAFLTVNLPFTFYIAGIGHTQTFVGSNTYLTFGSGSGIFQSLGESIPNLPKFHFGSADNSYQRVSTFQSSTDYLRIRYEGTAGTSGTVGTPDIVLEITLFNPAKGSTRNILELLVGTHARTATGGAFMVANENAAYATATLAQNQSYVFRGNDDGTSWQIFTGYNVSY